MTWELADFGTWVSSQECTHCCKMGVMQRNCLSTTFTQITGSSLIYSKTKPTLRNLGSKRNSGNKMLSRDISSSLYDEGILSFKPRQDAKIKKTQEIKTHPQNNIFSVTIYKIFSFQPKLHKFKKNDPCIREKNQTIQTMSLICVQLKKEIWTWQLGCTSRCDLEITEIQGTCVHQKTF